MKTTSVPWTRRSLTVTAMLSLLCLTGCLGANRPSMEATSKPQETVRVIPADKVVKRLPNGNFEVTAAWLQERYRLESWQAAEINRLRGE